MFINARNNDTAWETWYTMYNEYNIVLENIIWY